MLQQAGLLNEQRRIREELEERFREMADKIPEVIWITALNPEKVSYCSPSFERIWGLPVEERYRNSRLWVATIHPADRDRVSSLFSEWIAGGEVDYRDVEYRIMQPNGTVRWIHERGVLSLNDQGRPSRVSGISTDITERKQAEEDLRRSEAYLAEAQSLSHTGSFGWSVSSGELFWSEETYRIVGVDRAIKPTLELVFQRTHPEDVAAVRQTIERATRQGSDLDFEHRFLIPDGSVRHVHVVARASRRQDGSLEYIGAATDVTATKTAWQQIQQLRDQHQRENVMLREEVAAASMFEEIVGVSAALRTVLSRVSKVAPTDSTVLITGETGTGKELIARAIHKRSKRSARVFVSVNCAAIPAALVASELFGHEKGAFTGALQRRTGRFELAEGGTIFLDEVGELRAETQIALLRVLQEGEFERVGGMGPIRANVRLIAATNRDLKAAIASGAFRSDLFYRLNVFPIEMPSLRARKEDISLLTEYFVHRYANKMGKRISGISKATLERFQSYAWPGNIQELQNVVERSVVVCESETFTVDESWLAWPPLETEAPVQRLENRLATNERALIEAALAKTRGRVSGPSGAAGRLGMPASTLESKIRALKINKHRFKTA
jgi:PAS domain S-box-containing protein